MSGATTKVELQERRLIAAMLAGDVATLDALIDDRVVFTDPSGKVLSKSDDLAAHREGLLKVSRFDLSALTLQEIEGIIVSTSQADLAGTYAGSGFAGRFAYTRVWIETGGDWRVIAGQATPIT